LKVINKLSDQHKYRAFSALIEEAKKSELMKTHRSDLLGIFPKLPDIDKLRDHNKKDVYFKLIKAIEGTDLEVGSVFKKWKKRNPRP